MNFPSIFARKQTSPFQQLLSLDDITTLIQNLDPNKAHGHGMLSICMLKLCSKSISKPLDLILQSYIKHGKFTTEWKKASSSCP